MILNVPEQSLQRPNKLRGEEGEGEDGGGGAAGRMQDLLSLRLDLMAEDVSEDTLRICLIYLTFLQIARLSQNNVLLRGARGTSGTARSAADSCR